MNKQTLKPVAPKLLKREQATERYSMCWNVLLRAAKECGAVVRYGRSIFLNSTVLDRYFDSISSTE